MSEFNKRTLFIQSLRRLYKKDKITKERIYDLLQQKTINLEEYREILTQEGDNYE